MTFPKRITEAPSPDLSIAIKEAIREHAKHYAGGIVHFADLIGNLVDVTAEFIAELKTPLERSSTIAAAQRAIQIESIAKHIALEDARAAQGNLSIPS